MSESTDPSIKRDNNHTQGSNTSHTQSHEPSPPQKRIRNSILDRKSFIYKAKSYRAMSPSRFLDYPLYIHPSLYSYTKIKRDCVGTTEPHDGLDISYTIQSMMQPQPIRRSVQPSIGDTLSRHMDGPVSNLRQEQLAQQIAQREAMEDEIEGNTNRKRLCSRKSRSRSRVNGLDCSDSDTNDDDDNDNDGYDSNDDNLEVNRPHSDDSCDDDDDDDEYDDEYDDDEDDDEDDYEDQNNNNNNNDMTSSTTTTTPNTRQQRSTTTNRRYSRKRSSNDDSDNDDDINNNDDDNDNNDDNNMDNNDDDNDDSSREDDYKPSAGRRPNTSNKRRPLPRRGNRDRFGKSRNSNSNNNNNNNNMDNTTMNGDGTIHDNINNDDYNNPNNVPSTNTHAPLRLDPSYLLSIPAESKIPNTMIPTLSSSTLPPSTSTPYESDPGKERIDFYLASVAHLYYRQKTPDNVGIGDFYSSQEYDRYIYPTLLLLLSPLREPHVLDYWSAYEINLFEAGMMTIGKDFHLLSRLMHTKRPNELIDMYYLWKKTFHYAFWKAHGKLTRKFNPYRITLWDKMDELVKLPSKSITLFENLNNKQNNNNNQNKNQQNQNNIKKE